MKTRTLDDELAEAMFALNRATSRPGSERLTADIISARDAVAEIRIAADPELTAFLR